ncbi:MAG: peptidylprolyl isomerase [Rhodospirillaceae bacterium]|nr:peptidylprolyl isomerase [Rhodospirillaceae bacterium]
MKATAIGVWVLSLLVCNLSYAAETWRALDPDNTLVLDTTKGRIVVELNTAAAPLGVARIKQLTRDGVYNGLQFHRVLDGFVAQTGNPNNADSGRSQYPDLTAEFTFKLEPHIAPVFVQRRSDTISGFLEAFPLESEPYEIAVKLKRPPRAWGAYCPGAFGMGREEAVNTANAEFFLMRDPSRRLDHNYTMMGMTIVGLDVIRAIAVGEPPAKPDVMTRATMLVDLPAAERPQVQVMDTASKAFQSLVAKTRRAKGADFSICDVTLPVR